MSKLFWSAIKLSPVILAAILLLANRAQTAETSVAELTTNQAATSQTAASISGKSALIAELKQLDSQPQQVAQKPAESATNQPSQNNPAPDALAQVTSVSQLSDVQPTDWAFQALQSLVERYGVIAGYPDSTFRGNRALTRYEFAAGLNAALDRVNELIAAGTADLVRREDLATLQRLQQEFATELATLRGRVDALEAQTAELEANQFSITTKLVGEVIVAVTDTFGDDVDDNTVLQDRVRLDFQTSFFGSDILHTRLAAGNAQPFDFNDFTSPNNTDFITFEGFQTFNVSPNYENDVAIDWLAYEFPLFGKSRGYIAAVGGFWNDYVPTVNPYFEDFTGGRGALSTFAEENPIYRIGGGTGVGVNLAFGGGGILRPSSLTLGYFADNAANPDEDFGLANGDYSALAQLNFNLGDRFALAATYVHAYHNAGDGIFDSGSSLTSSSRATGPVVGTALANDPSSLLTTGSVPLVTNSYGVEAAFRLSDKISLSAFGTYTDTILIGEGDAEIWTFGGGIAFPDLGKEGNLLGLFAGVQPTLTGFDAPNAQDFDNDYGLHVEGFYRYQLTDNISITPGVIWLESPGQSDDNEDVIIGTLRTTFNF